MTPDSQPTGGAPTRMFRSLGANLGLLLLLNTFSWGGNVVAARLAVGQISPMALICLRWAIVSLLFSLIGRRRTRTDFADLWPHRWRLLLLGGFGVTTPNALMFESARFTSGVNLAIIQGVSPVLVLLGGWLAFRARIGALRALGAVITLSGVALIAVRGEAAGFASLSFNVGDLLAFLGAVSAAGYALGLRNPPTLPPLALFNGIAMAAFVTSFPLMLIEAAVGGAIWPGLEGLAILSYVAIFTSIVGHVTFMRIIALIGPGRASLFQNLVPIAGAFLSVWLLGEDFHLYHAAALALVLGGIWISERLAKR